MSTPKDLQENDILILFPQSKTYQEHPPGPNAVFELMDDANTFVDHLEKRKSISVVEQELSLAQITQALEVRLHMLDEARERLKFYLDDIELEFLKK